MRGHGFCRLLPVIAVAALIACSSQAAADGLPVLGVDASRTGLEDPSAGSRYVTLAANRGTVVARIETSGGEIAASRLLRGRFTIPAVASDASPSGLSADGRTLVLIRPRTVFPQRRTTFAVVETGALRVRDTVTLAGDYSFDAISPDGSTVYLIRYLSPRDPTRYEVRALDLDSGQLLPEPIVDPTEPDERMAGLPITRASSPDGRWAYTLYDGNRHEPFIHALDTVGQRAVCIDLPQLENRRDLFTLALQVEEGDGELTVLRGQPDQPRSRPLLAVDTKSFEVGEPQAAPAGDDDLPWLLIGALGAALGLGCALLVTGRREAADEGSLEKA